MGRQISPSDTVRVREIHPSVTKSKRYPGLRAGIPNFGPLELEVIDRYARAMADGKYRSTSAAAPDCLQAHRELRARRPSVPPRSQASIRRALSNRAEKLGLAWTVSFWSPAEKRIAHECAEALIEGRLSDRHAAARECRRRLAVELGRNRTVEGSCWHIARATRALGIPAQEQKWTAEEMRVLRRYTRKAYAGRPCTISNMAKACSRALNGRRSPVAVRSRMKALVAEIRQPRFHGFSLPWEKQYFERYARKAAATGSYSKRAAARECLKALQRRQKRESRRTQGRVSPVYKREFSGVYSGIRHAARRLGLPHETRTFWSEEENRMCENWRRWYQRWRGVRRLTPLKQAAEGLYSELADKGYTRTLNACSVRIALVRKEYR